MQRTASALLVVSILAGVALADAVSITVPWLTMDPGARPGGMGKAFTAIADDVHATYYNPAGLAFFSGHMVGAMHSDRAVEGNDIYYDYLGYIQSFEKIGTFGVWALYSNAGLIAITKENPQPIGYMSAYGLSVGLSYGYDVIEDSLGVGGSVKFIYDHLSNVNVAQAVAADAGILWRTPLPKLSVGAVVMNLGSNLVYQKVPESLPRLLKLGLAYEIPFNDDLNELRFSFDYSKYLLKLTDDFGTELAEAVLGVGGEYWYADIVGLRVGYYYDESGAVVGTSFGFSLRYLGIQFDFAQQPEGELFGMKNRFSMSYTF
ncbi:PorV/PorQ family protein [bacterium]|nr:PorV/PorQ family protein [bacterium]